MKIVTAKIPLPELRKMAGDIFGDFVKAVVDVERNIMAVGGELHADEETLLIENGSEQKNLWGINIYPELGRDERIEFDSMINISPRRGNRTRRIDDTIIREKITVIVGNLIIER
ncbi:MAG: DUF5674 family protein [Endomicrobiia bacterium]|nr:DUF5674 family protein [Endomicrobiia bacterium]